MKKYAAVLSSLIFSFYVTNAQCDFNDDYSNASLWTQVGTNVEVSSGKVQFINGSQNGTQRRIYRSLGTTLDSTNHFVARMVFSPTSVGTQGSQPSVGHRILALTAGTQEPFNNCPDVPCTGLPQGDQDGIVVLFLSRNPADGDVFFLLKAKDSTNEYTSSANINVTNYNTTYYVQLNRLSATVVKLSVFSDTLFSSHISGSPIYDTIPSTVTNLNTVQHCNAVRGITQRELTGSIDNLCINFNDYTGIGDVNSSKSDINIYPNPSIGDFKVSFTKNSTGEMFVINNVGQTVYKNSFNNKDELNVSLPTSLDKGYYLIKVNTQSDTYTKPLILN